MEPIQVAAVLAAVVVLASMLSVELGISVALFELGLGVVLGNVFGLEPDAEWLVFLASFASIGIIDRTQFSLLLTVVVLSAIVPTAIAQRWFSPDVDAEAVRDAHRAAGTASRPLPAGERP